MAFIVYSDNTLYNVILTSFSLNTQERLFMFENKVDKSPLDQEDKNSTTQDKFSGQDERHDKQEAPTPQSSDESSYKDLYVRLNADFQNFKRRVEKERIEWMQSAQISLLEKLLPIFDELDRAIVLSEEQSTLETKTWLEGFILIQKNWHKELASLGVKEIPTDGQFDPTLHEALMHEASTDKKQGDIVRVFSKGYLLKDRVIKHAKVSVAQ